MFQSPIPLTGKVHIDGDTSLVGTVTAITFRHPANRPMYEVSWIANGVAQTASIEEYRLTAAV
jgi:hypothetical protein